jgi:hypothetical protein
VNENGINVQASWLGFVLGRYFLWDIVFNARKNKCKSRLMLLAVITLDFRKTVGGAGIAHSV